MAARSVDEMTTEEIELRLALIDRKQQRTATESGGAGARPPADGVIHIAPRQPRGPIDERWFRTLKTCPRCVKLGRNAAERVVATDFGVSPPGRDGIEYAISWCKTCRSETSNEYRSKPRKNASKNNPNPPVKPPRAPRKPKK